MDPDKVQIDFVSLPAALTCLFRTKSALLATSITWFYKLKYIWLIDHVNLILIFSLSFVEHSCFKPFESYSLPDFRWQRRPLEGSWVFSLPAIFNITLFIYLIKRIFPWSQQWTFLDIFPEKKNIKKNKNK